MRLAIAAILAALVAACAAPGAPKQYLLTAPVGASGAFSLPAIGLREIALPLYARRPQIASQDAEGALSASDDHRWADDPPRAATRLIARRLTAIGGGAVFQEPWPLSASPDTIVAIEVDRFIGALGGDVVLEGVVLVTDAAGRRRPATRPFRIETPTNGEDHAALADAYGAALASLAEELAAFLAAGA